MNNMNERTLISHFVYVAYIDVFSPDMILCSVAPSFYHHSVVIQHLVSDRLLSFISNESVHNVKKAVLFLRLVGTH